MVDGLVGPIAGPHRSGPMREHARGHARTSGSTLWVYLFKRCGLRGARTGNEHLSIPNELPITVLIILYS